MLSATTRATALFVFHSFVLLYAMYFFLTGGPKLLRGVLAYVPLADVDKQRMLEKFVSVTRATLKGTILIGAAQGFLGGLSFWVAGIEGPVFWGTVMTVLSIIPGVGGALVWVPAVIILAATGELWTSAALAAFNALVVGSIDNLMRPTLVGRDTQLHELMIFLSTLGGLMFFGASGFHSRTRARGTLRHGMGDVRHRLSAGACRAHVDHHGSERTRGARDASRERSRPRSPSIRRRAEALERFQSYAVAASAGFPAKGGRSSGL